MSKTPEVKGQDIKGRGAILNLYGAFAASLVLSALPSPVAAILSAVFFIGVLIAAYMIRKKVEEHSFSENHATFIIRTLWIAALFSLLTTAIATVYMMSGIDYTPFEPCANDLASRGLAWVESASTMTVYGIAEPCVKDFIGGNKVLLLNTALIAGGPVIVYMIYRIVKGLARATKGYRLANSKSWL